MGHRHKKQNRTKENDDRPKIQKILAILIGAPGSGKSFYCHHTLNCYRRISQDDQKRGHYKIFLKSLMEEFPLIAIDRMNFNKEQRQRYSLPARFLGYKISHYIFQAPDHILIKRMRSRQDHPTIDNRNFEKHKELIEFFQNNYEEPDEKEFGEITIVKTY